MMLMNAQPRGLSNSFETFVPYCGAEPSYYRLIEMTNNYLNSWGNPSPVPTSQSTQNGWDINPEDFSKNENLVCMFRILSDTTLLITRLHLSQHLMAELWEPCRHISRHGLPVTPGLCHHIITYHVSGTPQEDLW
jgi:hypothetical protein